MKRMSLWFPYILLLAIVAALVIANLPRQGPPAQEPAVAMCGPCGMEVDAATALRVEKNGHVHYYCSQGCRDREAAGVADGADHDRPIDVVCHMEVNTNWGIQTTHQGQSYHFCTPQCKELFDADPGHYLTQRCLVCKGSMEQLARTYPATYLGRTYELCSEEHRREFKADPASFFMHTMWGIPSWLYYGSIAMVLIVSFGVFDWLGRSWSDTPAEAEKPRPGPIGRDQIRGEGERILGQRSPLMSLRADSAMALPVHSSVSARPASVAARVTRADRFDLLTIGWLRAALGSRVFRFVLQVLFAATFLLIIAAGLFGNQNPALNIAPILTWTVWWGFLIVLILFAGKAWCFVCPWDAIAGWTERLRLWKKSDEGLTLGLKWPRVVRNISIATILFVGLTWVELGFGVTMKPRVTAYLAIAMLLMAVASALLFDRKSFCRYGCLVGRVSGLYALFSGVEVRSRHENTCTSCRTKECVKGSDEAYGCPTFLYPGKMDTNTYCIQCMECVQACPHDNLAVNMRPWGSDLAGAGKPRSDEAYLALLMLAITGFHGLTMTPVWQQFVDALRGAVGVGRILGFSLGMGLLMVGPIAVYAVLVAFSMRLGKNTSLTKLTYRDYFIRYAYALLPIALFYHIAHNLEHLLMEGPKVVALISDPFGWRWNLFGTAGWAIPPLISLEMLWIVQVLLVLVGHVYSLWVAQKTSLRLFGSPRAAFRSQVPMLIGMIAFSVFSLWLLKQPMEMRTSAM